VTSYIGLKAWDMGFDAHFTLYYFGRENSRVEEMRYFLDEFKYATQYNGEFVRRASIDLFHDDLPVVRVEMDPYSQLHTLRNRLLDEFKNVSQYEFTPHITLDLKEDCNIILPPMIKLSDLDVY
jgi:2'-5' RNA ligase